MKNLIWLLAFLPVLTYSQTIFTGDMLWSTMEGHDGGDCCNGDPCTSYYTKITSDSIINGIQYKRVVNSTDSLMNSWETAGFIREEGQKVFYRKKDADTERLMYDFGCSVGDTLGINFACDPDTKFKVDSIINHPVMGESRKHFYLSYLSNDGSAFGFDCWIDGIGSIFGILNAGKGGCIIGFYENLLCCFKDGKKIYSAPGCDDCFYYTPYVNSSYEHSGKNQSPILYPNPASDYIYIQTESEGNGSDMEVLSLDGSILISKRIHANQEKLDINTLHSGIYIVRLKDPKGTVNSKFIKL